MYTYTHWTGMVASPGYVERVLNFCKHFPVPRVEQNFKNTLRNVYGCRARFAICTHIAGTDLADVSVYATHVCLEIIHVLMCFVL